MVGQFELNRNLGVHKHKATNRGESQELSSARWPPRNGTRDPAGEMVHSFRRRRLDVIDNEDFDWTFRRIEFKSKLFL